MAHQPKEIRPQDYAKAISAVLLLVVAIGWLWLKADKGQQSLVFGSIIAAGIAWVFGRKGGSGKE